MEYIFCAVGQDDARRKAIDAMAHLSRLWGKTKAQSMLDRLIYAADFAAQCDLIDTVEHDTLIAAIYSGTRQLNAALKQLQIDTAKAAYEAAKRQEG